jgi:PGF-pre-PGF domain-containing protein
MALVFGVLLVGAAFATSAAAVPQMVFRGSDVADETVLVGENVTVTATVENIGDSGGGFTLEYSRNGTQFASDRVTVSSETERHFNRSVSFDSPGAYEITVNGDTAGVVTVSRAVATVDSETADQRTVNVRARSAPTNESATVSPPSSNRSFALEQWSVHTQSANFNQVVTEYTNLSSSTVVLPPENESSLVGLLTADSNVTVENATMRFAIEDSRLDEAGIDQSQVTVFQHTDDSWEPLETTVVEQRTQSAVYEATGTSETEYAVGSIDASISVADTSLQTESTESSQLLRVVATLQNDGSVAGTYNGTLTVNGAEENATTVTVPAAGEETLTLTHEVTDAATYELALGDTSVGSVVITEGQVTSGSATDSGATESSVDGGATATADDQQTDGGASPAGDVLPDSVPATIFGIDTLYIGAGAGLVLGMLIGALVMSRRGGGGDDMGGFEL